MRTRSYLIVTIGAGLVGLGALAAGGRVGDQPPQTTKPQQAFPDLVGALKATDGCLGIELARTQSGKNVIFAWFQDKKAMLTWYYVLNQECRLKFGVFGRLALIQVCQ